MDADGRLFKRGSQPEVKARVVELYERLDEADFAGLEELDARDLAALAGLHALRLEHLKEERRMHFGAFALVGLAIVILLPAVLTLERYFLPLAGVELLLLALLVPYTFYYRKYEESVRRLMRASMLIENARLDRSG